MLAGVGAGSDRHYQLRTLNIDIDCWKKHTHLLALHSSFRFHSDIELSLAVIREVCFLCGIQLRYWIVDQFVHHILV